MAVMKYIDEIFVCVELYFLMGNIFKVDTGDVNC